MIIDCHTHLNNYVNEEVDSLTENLENLQREMRKNRVDISLVLTSYKLKPGRPSTRDAVNATRNLKHIYIIAGLSYLSFEAGQLSEIKEYMKEGSVRGLKIYPGYEPFYPSDEKFRPAYELAEEFDLPVMIHTGDTYDPRGRVKYAHPLNVDDVAVDFPNVKFIICHLGNPWLKDTMEVVYKNQNVYTDMSGLVLGNFNDRFEQFMAKQFQEMCAFGMEHEKVLYGTDWPLSSMDSYLNFLKEIRIPDRDRKKIMWENAAKLFKLSPSHSMFEHSNSIKKIFS